MKRANTLLYMVAISSCILTSSCKDKTASQKIPAENKQDSLSQASQPKKEELSEEEKHFQKLMNCVIHDDAATFAHLTSYPIMRTYPMKWIEDSVDMMKFFPIMADDSLKNVLRRTSPSDWEQIGWRGYTFANGQYFWDEGYKLSGINYVSKHELAMREALIKRDLSTIHPSLKAKVMAPFSCFYDTKNDAVYRVDILGALDYTDENAKYRMAVYLKETDLMDKPDYLLNVDYHLEGSAGVRVYECSDEKGNSISFYQNFYEQSNNFEAEVKLGKKKEAHIIARAYWLDFFDTHQVKKRK